MKPRIAIVDDDSIFQFSTKVKIQKLELASEIIIFNDCEEILEFLKSDKKKSSIDIILLDINMPMLDGWDFLEEYAKLQVENDLHHTIYMLSSSINPVDVEKAKNNKWVEDYIIKPIKDEDLGKIFKTK
ncbi:MAG: hypothetical protein RLZZ337_811 [Bacteroidota bacterium]|jgi:CheY-like chemotaxis protein